MLCRKLRICSECTEVRTCLNIAINGIRDGGRVALVGLNPHKVSVSLSSAGFKELQLIGIRRYVDNRFVYCFQFVY